MASNAINIALHGYDATQDTDPNHFALFADQVTDYILIKEKARGLASVSNFGTVNISHGLGYVPFCLAFVEITPGVWRKLFSHPLTGGVWFEINGSNLVLRNESGAAKNFAYYIFYDNIT